MDLDTVDRFRHAFYRLVGSEGDDQELIRRGEELNEVADLFLTRGCRNAQRYMLSVGYTGWRTRSGAIEWLPASFGQVRAPLPGDFMRAYGDERRSALVDTDGRRWGAQARADIDHIEGNFYFIDGEAIRLTKRASPPTTLFLDYHYRHAPFSDTVSFTFPLEARPLIVAEAADLAKEDNWLPGGPEMERKIERALQRARTEARDVARSTKQPRSMRRSRRYGNRW